MNLGNGGNIKIFSGNAHVELAKSIASLLNVELGKSEVGRFSDGEISLKINESVRNADVYIIQPISMPVNENLMELLIMIDAMKRASAGTIAAVIPYYGYARQDRKSRARDPISAKLVANLITSAGCDRVITMDLHCAQIQGFFDIPLDHLVGMPKFRKYYMDKFKDMSDVVVVSPDLGSVARARSLADKLNVPIAIIDKRRAKPNESEVMNIIGDVSGRKVLLLDDMIDTAGSITNAAVALKNKGATEIFACCTHGVLSGPALERLEKSPISELVMLDTIAESCHGSIDKIKYLTVADVFAEAICRIHDGKAVSVMFD
ncbi:ribose-phosphate diphosphokinase [Anaeropeptidivorans aminofermentans]|jgi:ribose-phosphate pyrophosphokinase|uniref:ribose-phosphate diphosphokinase n=1 Tax=Anaeropeptidivorans aminofermentans TaxID=2934315 RepID=UPI0020256F4C|nr:ribose-phosphate pyrophosphokinase [Anaeropeptidivorans aminofermentans]MBE6013438.1 ribose-phosphate pyrophosphokinase [Lachnospiraceae bacterium]